MAEPFLSEISIWALTFAVRDWAFCDGQVLAVSQNQALASLLKDYYGGNGQTTFGLPDFRGRSPKGWYAERLGTKAGQEAQTLTTVSLTTHSHSNVRLGVRDSDGETKAAAGLSLAQPTFTTGSGAKFSGFSFVDDSGADTTISTGLNETLSTGSGLSFSVRSPYSVINYEIALKGAYPPRN
ncbi:phage tail protein [Flexibacterium corallicola]|uniref:phage tail protein n=1 Tax=Flexibacterium corallicola TaxID=3037259 RepID=UPI00286EE3BC|nr:tail fiber protein [Pseudovibrio sp. M1P-2-3]